jgi:hypothetical protein
MQQGWNEFVDGSATIIGGESGSPDRLQQPVGLLEKVGLRQQFAAGEPDEQRGDAAVFPHHDFLEGHRVGDPGRIGGHLGVGVVQGERNRFQSQIFFRLAQRGGDFGEMLVERGRIGAQLAQFGFEVLKLLFESGRDRPVPRPPVPPGIRNPPGLSSADWPFAGAACAAAVPVASFGRGWRSGAARRFRSGNRPRASSVPGGCPARCR